jgi:hypothetical protein
MVFFWRGVAGNIQQYQEDGEYYVMMSCVIVRPNFYPKIIVAV